jgi:hypothetical protein
MARGAAAIRQANRLPETYQMRTARAAVLAAMGLTPEDLGKRLRLAFDTAMAALEATETKYLSHEGVVTDERTVEAHKVQLKAVHEIGRLIKMLAKGEAKPVTVHVQVTNA